MSDIFISYSRENQALVRRLAEAVKREGYSVWWDDELPPHRSYGDVITEQIGSAKAAIVVWSESAAGSEWVRAEADVARNQKKLIQVSIDKRMPPMPFNQLHFVSIGDWRGEEDHPGWRKVKESLAALCGAGASPLAYPMPTTPPPGATAPPAAASPWRKWHRPLMGVIALSFLVIAAVALLAWMRGGAEQAAVKAPPQAVIRPSPLVAQPDTADAAPPSAPQRAAQTQPRPAKAAPEQRRPPVNMRAARRYCMGRGRDTPECRRLRAQYGY